MKKKIWIMVFLLSLPAWANVSVMVEGRALPSQPAPLISEGRVLVPLRAVFEALQAKVDYRDSTITANRQGKEIQLKPGERKALVDGKPVLLDAPARLISGTTYVPLRFVAQSLGESVAWNASSKSVVIGEGVAISSGPSTNLALAPMLKRLVVGNQGGVLKVWDPSGKQVVFYRGLDDRSVAPLSSADQDQILTQLQLSGNLDGVARQLMKEYPTKQPKEALALLGVLNSLSDARLSQELGKEVRSFLVRQMANDASVHNRRQSVLALAVGSQVEPSTVDAVLDFYRSSENLWETFPVQQFFEYHAGRIQQLPNFGLVKQEALAVNSLYRANIAGYLE